MAWKDDPRIVAVISAVSTSTFLITIFLSLVIPTFVEKYKIAQNQLAEEQQASGGRAE